MNLQQYIANVSSLYGSGKSTEHSYRGDLQQLLTSLLKDVSVTNEPKRIECGAPDYILTRKEIPVGYIEAKDVGVNLGDKLHKEQFDRYRAALNNLIITDYLGFHFYKNGELTESVFIGEIGNGKVHPLSENFEHFTTLIQNFAQTITQSIKSPEQLAKMMASRARLMANVIFQALEEDDKTEAKSELQSQREAFKSILIHDIDNLQFADIYAQTIAYGLFAARYHDPTLATFSREEAARLIPHSNPFLRKLFQTVATYSLEDGTVGQRLLWVVEELVQVFLATDVAKIMKNFGRSTRQQDPVVHFYETFLSEYDPQLRKARGVWYTPEPVVNFIVRAVDEILKTKFNLPLGLADTAKTKIKIKTDQPDRRTASGYVELEKEVHKVQILDPATGTGTFLAKTIEHIYERNFVNQAGAWPSYVKDNLIPRLNGFELLMTSYAMAHLKIDMLLSETGYKTEESSNRLRIFLTNSLEEHHPDTGTLFSSWLSTEANEANHIKRDTPVMVVMGNPPYSGISSNNGSWIAKLIDDYKYIDGEHFNERKHWLNDDYVKFIRYGQHFIDKRGEGVLAFINPHGFLDNPTFRGMRWNLLKSFDEIYTIDLHGNSKKKETAPDGSKDENVFDIMQGVSINIFVKTGSKNNNELGVVYHRDVYGSRPSKYEFLTDNTWKQLDYNRVKPTAPNYFFVPRDVANLEKYEAGFNLEDLFSTKVSGIVTARDSLVIDFNKKDLLSRIEAFADTSKSDEEVRRLFFGNKQNGKYLAGDARGWSLSSAREKIKNNRHLEFIQPIAYRPFDTRQIYYSQDMVDWGRFEVMRNMLDGSNIGISTARSNKSADCDHFLVSQYMTEAKFAERTTQSAFFPLYIYSEAADLYESSRTPNFNSNILQKIVDGLGLKFVHEESNENETFCPTDLLDYIYAVLYSPNYRETYKDFLKTDFPRVPYPKDKTKFLRLVTLGHRLRELHLLEGDEINNFVTSYPQTGTNMVESPRLEDSKVYINSSQYFDGVPETAWNFSIGGYQPAQKWLKDRKGCVLSFEEILYYQKIIKALVATSCIMNEIDSVITV